MAFLELQDGTSWVQVGLSESKLAPNWSQVAPKLALRGTKLAPSWLQIGLSWPPIPKWSLNGGPKPMQLDKLIALEMTCEKNTRFIYT